MVHLVPIQSLICNLSRNLTLNNVKLLRVLVLPLSKFPGLARKIPVDTSHRDVNTVSTFPKWIDDNNESRDEHPDDADNNPTSEELLGKNILASVHWHWPNDQKGNGHEQTSVSSNFGSSSEQFLLLFSSSDSFFLVDIMSNSSNMRLDRLEFGILDWLLGSLYDLFGFINSLDVLQNVPVKVLWAESKGQHRNKNKWRKQSNNISGKHGVVLKSRVDRDCTELLFGTDQPTHDSKSGCKNWRPNGCMDVLLA
ncbi:hypothetical protein OGAPHI_005418 [Ogataea philodendri]|uniref:Uncharacterized protein n=1 Tax=Ogataea philodendri TaxID=1378263 RepID=A0A9P8NZ52_9ASCO|nr:uncharacterized protein OGAPHI_005418 [Ogataea philodendri]KAH3662170.1 hypothetical protein OGAPHI_005418 [Ogataea philodendri]